PLVRRIGISGVEAECAFDLFAARSDAGELCDMKLLDVPLAQFVAIDAGDGFAILQFPEAQSYGFFVRPQSRNSDGDWKDEPESVFQIVGHNSLPPVGWSSETKLCFTQPFLPDRLKPELVPLAIKLIVVGVRR